MQVTQDNGDEVFHRLSGLQEVLKDEGLNKNENMQYQNLREAVKNKHLIVFFNNVFYLSQWFLARESFKCLYYSRRRTEMHKLIAADSVGSLPRSLGILYQP